MARLSISLLGSPQFAVDGEIVELPRRKAAALLAYLATQGGRHSRSTLATLFWPESQSSRAFAYLRNMLWEINRAMGDGWLDSDRESIGLEPGADIYIDVEQFHNLLERVIPHTHPTDEGCAHCADLLESATRLFRGEFMSGFSLPDCPVFDDWQFFKAEESRQALMDGLIRLIRMQVSMGEHSQALEYARTWSNLDPINEDAHRELMYLYAISGQRNAAIRQYRECSRILAEELNVEPELATTQLYERIQTGAFVEEQKQALTPEVLNLNAQSTAPATATTEELDHPIYSLPIPPTPFIGRREELNEISARLADQDVRLITLLGPGGIGKTRLALQAASRHQEHYPDQVCFVPLGSLRSDQPILPAITDALGISIQAKESSTLEQLTSFLQNRQMLLVLDNFEHLVDEAPVISKILEQTPDVKFLITSRRRLNLRGEWVVEVTGFQFPETNETLQISGENGFTDKYSAVQFFLQSARRSRTDFTITPPDYPSIARITQMVAGVPLGLELAAGWVNVLTPTEIAAEVSESMDFLKSSLQDIPERQRSMRAVFDQSWKLMSGKEQKIFPKLAVFRGGFSRDAAKKVLAISTHDLMGLVNKTLVQRGMDGRFNLHPMLHQYAAEKLLLLDSYKNVKDAHCAYYAAAMQGLGESIIDQRQRQALTILAADIDNALAAWYWAVEQRKVRQIDQSVFALMAYLNRQIRFTESRKALQAAEFALAQPETPQEKRVLGHILAWHAISHIQMGYMDRSTHYFERSWDQIDQADAAGEDTRYEKAFLYNIKADVAIDNGNLGSAREILEKSLALYKEIDHKFGASETLFGLAWLSTQEGQQDDINRYYQKSLELKRQIGDQSGIANDLYYMASNEAFHRGNLEKAASYFENSIELFQDLGDVISTSRATRGKDDLAIINGNFAEALKLRLHTMKIYENLGDILQIGFQHMQIGEVYYHLGDYDQSEKSLRQSKDLFKDRIVPFSKAFSYWQLGMTLIIRGEHVEAHQLFSDCIDIYKESNRRDGVGSAYAGLALADYHLGNYEQAWKHLQDSLNLLLEYPHFFWMFYTLGTASLLLIKRGEGKKARELYTLISQFKFVLNSCWFNDVFQTPIQAATEHIPQDELQIFSEPVQSEAVWQAASNLFEPRPLSK